MCINEIFFKNEMWFCKQVKQKNLFAYILKSYPNSVLERKNKKHTQAQTRPKTMKLVSSSKFNLEKFNFIEVLSHRHVLCFIW